MPVRRSAGNQLGADGSREDFEQGLTGVAAEVLSLRNPSNDVLDQRLRHARVDAVMRHVIADAVGAPSKRKLAQISGANDEAAVQISQSKKMAGALARLHVLEGDVVNFLAFGIRMSDVLKHLHAARPDVYFFGRADERLHQATRLIERARAGGEARHRDGENFFARRAEPVHRTSAYQQRMRRIDPP